MSVKEICTCGHDKASHFQEENTSATGPEGQRKRLACLASFCDCKKYEPKKEK
jgi:hypothetical protein